MSVPNWSCPPSGETARGIALIPFGGASGMAVADWTAPKLWPFSGGAFGQFIGVVFNLYGLAGAAADGSGGAWSVTWDGTLTHTSSGGTEIGVAAMPAGAVYVGAASVGGSGFALAASGNVYASGGALLGAFPFPCRPLLSSGTTLAALMPASGIGSMNASNGATGIVPFPAAIATPTCFAVASGEPLALGGWRPAAPLSGAAAAVLDPQNAALAAAVGSGFALQWQAPAPLADAWSQTQALTGLANLTTVAWSPDGTKLLACSPASGVVQALSYAANTLSLAQTIALSGACSAAIAGDSAHALVAQSGMGQATPLTYTSSWSSGTPIGGLAGIVAVAAYGASGAVAAVGGGLQYLDLSGGLWSSGAAVALPFAPTALTVDQHGAVYAAGSDAVAMVTGTVLVASGMWAGQPATSIAVQQGRIVVAAGVSPGDGLLRVFGLTASGTLAQESTTQLATGTVGLALSETTLFAMQASGTALYGFSGSPYALTPVRSGVVGFYNGSAWATLGMGVGNVPAAIGLGPSGDAWVATVQNTLWHVSSGAALIASGALQQAPGQPQTVPLCPSAILAASGGVWVATSIPGLLEQVA